MLEGAYHFSQKEISHFWEVVPKLLLKINLSAYITNYIFTLDFALIVSRNRKQDP